MADRSINFSTFKGLFIPQRPFKAHATIIGNQAKLHNNMKKSMTSDASNRRQKEKT